MININYILINVFIFSFGLYIFLTAYFPTTIQNVSSSVDLKPNVDRKIHRTVIMVIDALREDLLNDSESMPFLNTRLNDEEACFYSTKVEMPTVTMPRIKALTTGTIPNFIDVLLNFESGKLNDDNIIQRAFDDGQKIIFYGDETWIKLFPNIFIRSEGTTSFYVTDYTEVDDNVTRHLNVELEKHDWDIMILHYLGLDHIGHLEGPNSALMKPKLYEMNNIIETIHQHLKKWELMVNKQSLFIVTSDHGMKDSGGHGGSSRAEMIVPLVVLGLPCKSRSIAQTDVAPTLAVLFGVPYPKSSIGKLIPDLLNLNKSETLNAFETYYNHLVNLVSNSEQSEFTKDLVRKKNDLIHANNDNINDDFHKLYSFYNSEIEIISDYLTSSRCIFDIFTVYISTFLLWTTTLVIFFEQFKQLSVYVCFWSTSALVILCHIFHIIICYLCNNCSDLCNSHKWIVVLILYLLVGFNVCKLISVDKKIKISKEHSLVITSIIVHIVQIASTLSSSYVEEEQHTWFFYTSSFLIIIFYKLLTNKNTIIKSLLRYSILLISHRLIRELNISYVDVTPNNFSIWLYQKNHVMELSIIFIAGLATISLLCKFLFKPNIYVYVLINISLLIVYSFRSASGIILSFFPLGVYREFFESWTLFICIFITVITHLYSNKHNNNRNYCYLHTFLLFWIMLCTLLLRPHNVLLIPVLILTSYEINQTKATFIIRVIIHYWLGKTFYFYQGTTNNIATVDVASGYVGQTSYIPFVVGILILVHTYSMPILSHLLLAVHLLENKKISATDLRYCMNQLHSINLLLIFSSISFYCVVMILHRTHLFIWSVFSPKLLFDIVYVLVIILCNLLTEVLGFKYNRSAQLSNNKHVK